MSTQLVAYFSASGKTKQKAEDIAKRLDADIVEIIPREKYSAEDLKWNDPQSRTSIEMKDMSFRPEIEPIDIDVQGYDTVYIGFPIWWYTAPNIVYSFLDSADFSEKTIVLFATSGGTGIQKSLADLTKAYPQYSFQKAAIVNTNIDALV